MATNSSNNTPKLTTNGQLLIGNTGNNPSAATLTAGSNVTITNGAGTITIAAAGASTANPTVYYVDYINGSNSNNGSISSPWLTLQYAYNTLSGIASVNNPCSIYLSTDQLGTSPDTGTITGYANISLFGWNGSAILNNDIVISGTSAFGDSIYMYNIFSYKTFTWAGNNGNYQSLEINNCQFYGAITFTNVGSGGFPQLWCYNSFLKVFTTNAYSANFIGCTFQYAINTAYFNDASTTGLGYGEIWVQACNIGGIVNIAGAQTVRWNGNTATSQGTFSIAGSTVSGNTPILYVDASFYSRGSITGAITVNNFDGATYIDSTVTPVNYTATNTQVSGSLVGIDNALGVRGSPTWTVVTANTALAANRAYFANSASTLTFTLPSTASVGQTFGAAEMSTGTFVIAQNSGQKIVFGKVSTTTGTGGNITSTGLGDSVVIVCTVTNTTFQVISSMGNLTVT